MSKSIETVTIGKGKNAFTINADDYKNGIKDNKDINKLIAESKAKKKTASKK